MKIIKLVVASALAFSLAACGKDKTEVRILHASPDAPAVDVLVNDRVRVSGLAYGDSSEYRKIKAGSSNLKVNAAGTDVTVIDADVDLEKKTDYTVIAVGNLDSIEPLVLVDNNDDLDPGTVRVRVVHGSPSVPNVDVYVGAPGFDINSVEPALGDVPFKAVSEYLTVPPGAYQILITAAGDKTPVFDSGSVELPDMLAITLVALETNEGVSPVKLAGLTNLYSAPQIDIVDTRAEVRVIHASPDAPNVDVLYNDEVVLSDVPFLAGSGYLTVDSGAQNFKVNAAGTDTTVIDVTPELMASTAYTVIATDFLGSITPLLLADDNVIETEGNIKLRVVHGSPDAPNVDILVNGAVTIPNVPFGVASDFLEVPADTYSVAVNVAGTDTTVLAADLTLEAGSVYTVIATGLVADSTLDLSIYVE